MQTTQHNQIGRIVKVITDPNRPEILSPINEQPDTQQTEQARSFPVSVFYPIESDYSPAQQAKYLDMFAPAIDKALEVFQRMGANEQQMRHLPGVLYDNAPMTAQKEALPVILYAPGIGVDRDMFQYNIANMVAAGFLVITVGAPYDSLFTVMPDGEVIGQNLEGFNLLDVTDLRKLQAIRQQDITFVLDQLADWNQHDDLLREKVDLQRIGLIGHSLGGAGVYAVAETDTRVRAVILQDASLHLPHYQQEIDIPLLLMRENNTSWKDLESSAMNEAVKPKYFEGQRQMYNKQRGYKSFLKIKGSDHMTFTDVPVLFGNAEQPEQAEQVKRMQAVISQATVAFFNEFVNGKNNAYQDFLKTAGPESGFAEIDGEGIELELSTRV